MSSEVFIDDQGKEDGRTRSEVLPDYRFHQLLDSELGDIDINEALDSGGIEEKLPNDRIYFIDKIFYYTHDNVSLNHENVHKVNAGPNNEGRAGDIDVGYIHIPTGKIQRIELKSPGRIPERGQREAEQRTYNPIKHAEKQNRDMRNLLDAFEDRTGWSVPYSPRVEAWNDAVDGAVVLEDTPKYSESGCYVASPEAIERARNSEMVQDINDGFFKGWMLGGGENIIEEMDMR